MPLRILSSVESYKARALGEVMAEFDINAIDADGFSPLAKAAQIGDIEVVKLLLTPHYGAKANNPASRVALCLAAKARENSLEICRILLEHGADPDAKDTFLEVCFREIAAAANRPDLGRLLEPGIKADSMVFYPKLLEAPALERREVSLAGAKKGCCC